MGGYYKEVVNAVGEFALTLGYLPKSCAAYKNDTERCIARIRADIVRVARFHPKIDPLLGAELTLEEAIIYGMQTSEIEFFRGIKGITAERAFQKRRILPDSDVLQIRSRVYDDYGHLLDSRALAHTQETYQPLREEILALGHIFSLTANQ
jgi:hypothetical protein